MKNLEQPSNTPIATYIAVICIYIHVLTLFFLFLLPSEATQQPPEVTQPPVVPPKLSPSHVQPRALHHVHTAAGVFTLHFLLFLKML